MREGIGGGEIYIRKARTVSRKDGKREKIQTLDKI
jgi:hypothetical protein